MLRKQFRGFITYTEEEFKEIWGNSIVVIDTNVLLNFYKYKSKDTTKSLLNILKTLKENNRLWIPHQVALEYFFNYDKNMNLQNVGMKKLVEDLSKLKCDAERLINKGRSDHPYVDTQSFEFYIEGIECLNKQLTSHYENEIKRLPDSKEIKEDILNLLDGIIGDSYSQEVIDSIEKEGKLRYIDNVPPGFGDMDEKDKQDFRTYNDIRYQQKYGDLIMWNQIIDKAKDEKKQSSIIFITEEKKIDWWEKDGRAIKRPHPQLLQEFYSKTQEYFYMYRIDNFVENAKKYLEVDVTDEQIKEVAADIEGIRRLDEQWKKNYKLREDSNRIGKIDKTEYFNALLRAIKNIEFKTEGYGNPNKIKLDTLFKYLSNKERYIIQDMINNYHELGLDSSMENHNHSKTFKTAINWSIPKMEERFKVLQGILISLGIEENEKAKQMYDSLPKDSTKRAYELMEVIELMEELLEYKSLSQ